MQVLFTSYEFDRATISFALHFSAYHLSGDFCSLLHGDYTARCTNEGRVIITDNEGRELGTEDASLINLLTRAAKAAQSNPGLYLETIWTGAVE